ncbi:MAG: DUF1015 domain-containing protein, partial [Kiritimatiellae bacterium]|nr:DUF1015 domain-containing protein [Kiritimatiellia bacterium]
MHIKPFAALRPVPEKAQSVAAVPYDVVDTAEARVLSAGNPDSFLHVTRPEIALPDNTDVHCDAVYAQGAQALAKLLERGVLKKEQAESFYLYRQIMGSHSQTGVVACCHIDDYAQNIIRKHEKTRKDKEDDRTRHCTELKANTGPVFLTYRDDATLEELIKGVEQTAPLYDFTAPDGVRHTVWRSSDNNTAWTEAFRRIPLAYVADGHHRAAAAFRTGQNMRAANPSHNGSEEYNWFLAVLFPAASLSIMPYNRCVADLNGMSPEMFLSKVNAVFKTTPADGAEPSGEREVRMFFDGRWHSLAWDAFEADPAGRLDVSGLQDRLLAPLLGIDDPRTNTRIP